jgi:large subunit ribosomal protein L43
MQLTKLRFNYCEHGGSSRAIRDYIGSAKHIVRFCEENPHIDVIVKVRNGHHPYIEGHYVTGSPKQITVKNLEGPSKIQQVVDMLKNSSGRKITRLKQPVMTSTPSIQGVWTPMLDLQDTKFAVEIVEGPSSS